MLYTFDKENNDIEPVNYTNFAGIGLLEKDLENLLAKRLNDIYSGDALLMPIFQERKWQEEPDLLALDRDGNLFIFELKREGVGEDTTIQIIRYSQKYGQYNYAKLEEIYQIYHKYSDNKSSQSSLIDAHKAAFELDTALTEEQFNRKQKLIMIGGASDTTLIKAVNYWRKQGIDIDFIPYRLYEIENKFYLEFFAKPYDYHMNPRDIKGIIFDTNRSYNEDALWDMFTDKIIAAYGGAARYATYFGKNDYAFYYHKGLGIVAAAKILDSKAEKRSYGDTIEISRKVQFLTPQVTKVTSLNDLRYITPSELKKLLNKGFFFASTAKSPYLTKEESEILLDALKAKYEI